MSKNQHGSKFWQETTPTLPRCEFKTLLYSALPYLAGMIVDKYGNYLCQVIFKLASATERLDILTSIRNSLVDIAKDSRGTHALQTLIEKATMTE
jgi:23S rRNA G2069 N7-methylase RlmK/C1962 C5-methylase RlmI